MVSDMKNDTWRLIKFRGAEGSAVKQVIAWWLYRPAASLLSLPSIFPFILPSLLPPSFLPGWLLSSLRHLRNASRCFLWLTRTHSQSVGHISFGALISKVKPTLFWLQVEVWVRPLASNPGAVNTSSFFSSVGCVRQNYADITSALHSDSGLQTHFSPFALELTHAEK